MRPDNFEDISAVLALYRPGPMGVDSHTNYALRKNGKQEITPIHPELEEPLSEILGKTYGLIVYQEQVMAVAQKLAGYTLGQADLLRRAMGKKKKEVLDAEYVPFSEGMKANGYSPAAIKALWDVLVPFSDYAFNKAHTAAYGLISYWTAYLKQHYAPEYMAALLTSVKDDKDKMAIYLNECRRMKIQVLPPDVNESQATFTPVGNDIRFGLTAVRNVGGNVVDGIVAAREEHGRYLDFNDFMEKVPALVCNKRVIESLVKAGAFDDMKHCRRALVAIHETAVDQYVDIKRNEAIGQDSLFARSRRRRRRWRVRHLGDDPGPARVGQDDPARPRAGDARPLRLRPPAPGARARAGQRLRLHDRAADARRGASRRLEHHHQWPGHLGAAQDHQARRRLGHGHRRGPRRCHRRAAVPELLAAGRPPVAEDAIITGRGRLSRSKDQPEIMGQEVSLPDISEGPSGPVVISLPSTRCTPPVVEQLRDVLSAHPGMTEVQLRLLTRSATKVMKLDDRLRVTPSPALFADLKHLLGPGCLGTA